ncbi:putative DNA glycosylase At3g47830 [Cynara cardunculus var. scolymus]|uniref:putative DNA glycosylase At3g47830 n=1 Tax=Cynara cardunculus var. scolymus TaxID=59895 RepID=UPI000D62F3AC|nr:putative DNA glycosylase At3g47830 [Cynara cardunculus var. scolymus]
MRFLTWLGSFFFYMCHDAGDSRRRVKRLESSVLAADSKCIENAIRCGGLAPTKASCIKNMLSCLFEMRGELCLEYLRDLSVDEIKMELSQFKGIGPKRWPRSFIILNELQVACVLMFNLQQDDFPVDTHIFQIAKAIGWVPIEADTKHVISSNSLLLP